MKGHGSSVESHFVFPGGISPHFLRNHKLDVNFCEMPIIILNCETIQLYRERERERERLQRQCLLKWQFSDNLCAARPGK